MKEPPPEAELPQPGYPKLEWIEDKVLARWTFTSDDRATQDREFNYWLGWFGYDEADRPEQVQGNVWLVRSSMA